MQKGHKFFNKKQETHETSKEEEIMQNSEEESVLETETENKETSEDALNEETASKEDNAKVIKALEEENQKLKDEFLRALAETENVKKRCASEIEKNNKYAISSFAKELLIIADNLERALSAGKEENQPGCESILKGVELTQNELSHVFAKFGIVPMSDIGKVFDPNYHRVVQEIEDKDKPNGTIVAQLQTGYLINGRILREAMVVVTKGGK